MMKPTRRGPLVSLAGFGGLGWGDSRFPVTPARSSAPKQDAAVPDDAGADCVDDGQGRRTASTAAGRVSHSDIAVDQKVHIEGAVEVDLRPRGPEDAAPAGEARPPRRLHAVPEGTLDPLCHTRRRLLPTFEPWSSRRHKGLQRCEDCWGLVPDSRAPDAGSRRVKRSAVGSSTTEWVYGPLTIDRSVLAIYLGMAIGCVVFALLPDGEFSREAISSILAVGIVGLPGVWMQIRKRALIGPDGVTAKTALSSTRVPWEQVAGFEASGDEEPLVDLKRTSGRPLHLPLRIRGKEQAQQRARLLNEALPVAGMPDPS